MPPSQASQTSVPQVRQGTSAVILAIVILNTLGILLLFFKLDWDMRALTTELTLVRNIAQTEKPMERQQ